MSADVEKAFSVRQSMWWQGTSEDHGQGSVIGDHPSWQEARVLAGIDWDPQEQDIYQPPNPAELRKAYAEVMYDADLTEDERLDALVARTVHAAKIVEGFKRVYRDDNDFTLACKADTYQVINNSAFGEIFEAVLGQDNVKFETGGCLENGRKVWMLSYLDEPITLPGDETVTYPFLALMSRHDGEGATVLRPTHIRVVCKNTFNLAEMGEAGYTVRGNKNNGQFMFVHRGDWRDRMQQAKEAIGTSRAQTKAYQAWAAEMLLIKVTKPVERKFINTFIPEPPAGTTSDRVKANIETSRDKLREILASPTIAGAGVRGTAYGLVQAAGEYLDHARTARTWETKLNRTLLTPETLKGQAVKIVRELVDA